MANIENLVYDKGFDTRSTEELSQIARKGGIASGEARRKKATMLQTLEMLLEETNNKSGKTYRELATLGLIKGAINGNANNYRTMLEVLGELKQIEDDRKEREITKVEELLNKITDEAKK